MINEEKQYTWWFKTTSENPISVPPLLHPSCGLQRGDLFYHKHATGWQFWLRQVDEIANKDVWEHIDVGYIREDGRKLTVTQTLQVPSWVGDDWGTKKVRELSE